MPAPIDNPSFSRVFEDYSVQTQREFHQRNPRSGRASSPIAGSVEQPRETCPYPITWAQRDTSVVFRENQRGLGGVKQC